MRLHSGVFPIAIDHDDWLFVFADEYKVDRPREALVGVLD